MFVVCFEQLRIPRMYFLKTYNAFKIITDFPLKTQRVARSILCVKKIFTTRLNNYINICLLTAQIKIIPVYFFKYIT